jgi:hypothetical protein
VALSLPRGVSALLDPDDEPYLRILLACAMLRARLGLPAWTEAQLRALLDDAPPLPTNVIVFPRRPPR